MSWTRTATVATTLGDDVLLFYSMTARETLSKPFLYEVELLSERDDLDLASLLGQPISIGLEMREQTFREFNGIVSDFALVGQLGKRYARYRVSVRPWLWFLSHRKTSRIFQKESVPEVLKDIFREHGFSDFSEHLSSDQYKKREYLVQYRESDFNFVSRIMEEEGIYYYFKHEDGKHTLWLCDSYSAHDPVKGYEDVPYYPKMEGERRERDHIDTWFTTRRLRPGAYAAYDFNFQLPKEPVHGELGAPNDHSLADYEVYEYPGGFQFDKADDGKGPKEVLPHNADGEAVARIRLEELQADYEIVKGTGNARGLAAGALFTLSNFPREDQNKEYLLVDVNYAIHVSGYESGKVPDEPPDYRVTFSAADSHRPFRPARTTPKPCVEGPQTAIVVGKDGQDIWTDEFGRVKLQFHWDRAKKRNENASCWVRVAQIWAGSGFGAIHLPRIGQEVIVDFLEGDPDRPIVTGRVYNALNKVPYTLPDNQTQSGIKSRSTLKGTEDNFNELRFEDKKGQEEIHIQAEKDMSTLIKRDRTTTILRNDTLSIQGDQFIKIHGNLSMTVEGVTDKDNPEKGKPIKSSMAVTGAHDMKASDTISMTAPNKITLTVGGSSITMTPGSITLSAGGGASISLDSKISAAAADKATLVLDNKVNAKSADGALITLDPNAFIQGSGGGSVLVDANVLSKSKAGSKVLVDATSVTLDATQISGTGKTEVGFTTGPSSLKLTPAGADLKGATTNVSGTGLVSISAPLVKIN